MIDVSLKLSAVRLSFPAKVRNALKAFCRLSVVDLLGISSIFVRKYLTMFSAVSGLVSGVNLPGVSGNASDRSDNSSLPAILVVFRQE